MALTHASFVPEERKGGGGGGGGGGASGAAAGHSAGQGMDAGYNHATDAAQSTGPAESQPATHPVSGTPLPKGTGAGTGTIRKGGRGGK
jgi:hypothetical protein